MVTEDLLYCSIVDLLFFRTY